MKDDSILFFGGRFFHPFTRHQFNCLPSELVVHPDRSQLLTGSVKSDVARLGCKSSAVIESARQLLIDGLVVAGHPNVRAARTQAANVHSSQHLMKTAGRWVVDFEHPIVFGWYRNRMLRSEASRTRILRALVDPSCAALLPWSEAAKQAAISAFGSQLSKMRVVYPALHPPSLPDAPASERGGRAFRFLFVGKDFLQKGGLETVRAFRDLKHPSAELTVVSSVPELLQREVRAVKGVTVETGVTPERLAHLFSGSSAFVMPTHSDTFGFVFLEAFFHRLPCIASECFAVPEIIRDGTEGLLVPGENHNFMKSGELRWDLSRSGRREFTSRLSEPSSSYVAQLSEAMGRLIVDRATLADMATQCGDAVRIGRFSCERKRKVMAEIYREVFDLAS